MRTMMTLQEMATEVSRVREAKKDFVADTRRLALAPEPPLDENERPRQTLLKLEGKEWPFDINAHAHGQIAGRVGIPKAYYDRMLVEAPELLAENVNHWWHEKPEERMIRTLDGRARAFLSNRYRRIDNAELLEGAIMPTLSEIPDIRFESIGITDTRLYIKAVLPRIQAEVREGDIIQSGVVISNSEVGAGSLAVSTLLYRLVCKNGMISEQGVRKYHVGRKVSGGNGDGGDDPYAIFSDETLEADDRALMLKVRDLVKASANEAVFQDLVLRCKELASLRVETDSPAAAVELLGNRHSLSEGEQGSILTHLVEGGDLSAWGYLNAITRTANDVEDYDRATELERLGGVLLQLPAQDWRFN